MKTEIKKPAKTSGIKKLFLIGGVFSSVFLAGFLLFVNPASAEIIIERNPATESVVLPFEIDVSVSSTSDIACEGEGEMNYWGIILAGEGEMPYYMGIISAEYGVDLSVHADITEAFYEMPAEITRVVLYCSEEEGGEPNGVGTTINITPFMVYETEPEPTPSPTGWLPATFTAEVGTYVNDFINDGSPAIILVIGLALATLVINWLIGLFIKTKKK